MVSDLYCEILADAGFSVDCAYDGQQGFEKMKKGNYDLVLLDVMLPKIDGIEIVKKLKKQGKLKKSQKVIMLTNLSQEATESKEERLDVDDYLIKSSLNPDELIEKVKLYLN